MAEIGSRATQVISVISNHDAPNLENDSYTAHRLKHASPEHLHLTTRRFFIGPIPEGWLKDNRKSWYKRRLELSTYSSRRATFIAAGDQGSHQRTRSLAGLNEPSTAARISFSFPQPEDVDDEDHTDQATSDQDTEVDDTEDDSDGERETRQIEPVSTYDAEQVLSPVQSVVASPKSLPTPRNMPSLGSRLESPPVVGSATKSTASRPDSFHTAKQRIDSSSTAGKASDETERQHSGLRIGSTSTTGEMSIDAVQQLPGPSIVIDEPGRYDSDDQRFSSSLRDSTYTDRMTPEGDTNSKTELLKRDRDAAAITSSLQKRAEGSRSALRSMQEQAPAPFEGNESRVQLARAPTGVRFKVSDTVAKRGHRIQRKVDNTRGRVLNKTLRRANTLREGTIIKMERMLVRIDTCAQQMPDAYDENESMKVDTRPIEKWREFMVVVRKSRKQDTHDFRLQFYKTRVIPEIDNDSTSKKPAREVRLEPKTTGVNLYSSLDKSVVVWHPYRKGSRIIIMKTSSTASSVEWYTFLRDAMGWKRPQTLLINVPDLDVQLHLENPFGGITEALQEVADEESAVARTLEAEQAVARRIIDQCLAMLAKDPEWADVLAMWDKSARMGLAWKRYDRLEWVHGIAEQKMYGSMAMSKTHDLELRPKEHYHTTARGKKGVVHEEPAPVEGFLIRLTSQKGVHKRYGKTFHKRLYYYTQNQFLMFNQPAKATPPHPPRLATVSGSNIPTSTEIIEKTPETFDVEPYPVKDGKISWLSKNAEALGRHDAEAVEEARRNIANVESADAYINLCRVRKVRKMKWGSQPGDENRRAGQEDHVDFHEDVSDSSDQDGTTTHIDDDRCFEVVHENGLVVRLQAYSKEARGEWIRRLRTLVKYWKLRISGDTEIYKAVRRTNLSNLNIDEEMEALLGQFGRKWEVSRSEASPELYHMCGIANCRTITMSGILFRKPRRRSTFHRCSVLLSAGKLFIHQATLRKRNGETVRHLHQDRQEVVELSECYVYSGLLVQEDLLYQNQTFDANNVASGGARTPRVYLEGINGEAWTSQDVDVMTCFVLWRNTRRGWFRSQQNNDKGDGKTSKIKRVAQLGVPGKGMVFKCRSRAERDHWVLSISAEIERVVELDRLEQGAGADARVTA